MIFSNRNMTLLLDIRKTDCCSIVYDLIYRPRNRCGIQCYLTASALIREAMARGIRLYKQNIGLHNLCISDCPNWGRLVSLEITLVARKPL